MNSKGLNYFERISQNWWALLIVFMIMLNSGCVKNTANQYGPFLAINDSTVVMNGDMTRKVDNQFQSLLEDFPAIQTIIMEKCPGSRDDEEMFEAAMLLHTQGINTHLPANAKIESGAVDFYLAGATRTREIGSRIGVHSWSDGNNSATDYPYGHSEHELYISYYENIGFERTEAENLYYFIIESASSNNMHWMTEEEIEQYGISNN